MHTDVIGNAKRIYKGFRRSECLIWAPFGKTLQNKYNRTMLHLSIYAISIHCAIHGIQARSIQNDTLENRIVALEKLVENLEDRIKNGTNSSNEGLL